MLEKKRLGGWGLMRGTVAWKFVKIVLYDIIQQEADKGGEAQLRSWPRDL
jgi:hypothetical protein